MHLGYQNLEQTYHLNGHALESSHREKDLCVIIDDKLKFHDHTAKAAKKANQILGVMKRSYNTRDKMTMCTLYKAIVRPHLDYGNAIWGPFYQNDIKKIESIQRRATKLISHLKDKTYEDRLRDLELPSLIYRRRRGDVVLMFNIMDGLVRMDTSDLFTPAGLWHTSGHTQKVFKTHAARTARVNTFPQRVANEWNALPNYVIMAPSINLFKKRLGDHW